MSLLLYKARLNRAKALKHLQVASMSGRKHKRPALILGAQYRVSPSDRAA